MLCGLRKRSCSSGGCANGIPVAQSGHLVTAYRMAVTRDEEDDLPRKKS